MIQCIIYCISSIGELPPCVNPNGSKVLDKDLMEHLQEYINRLSDNSSILNLILFKKFLADNVEDDIPEYEIQNNDRDKNMLNLIRSVRGKSELFRIRDVSPHGSDSEDELFK